MTLAGIAQHLQVREETIHRWMRAKNMPAHRVGRVWRFKASEVRLPGTALCNGMNTMAFSMPKQATIHDLYVYIFEFDVEIRFGRQPTTTISERNDR